MHSKTNYTHYLKLTPLGDFFFGRESFADKGAQNFYFQESENMPQQTSLLGLLRYQLLVQNNLASKNGKFPNKTDAGLLVGNRSFDPAKPESFGNIQQLSPVFITDDKATKYLSFPQVQYYKDEADKKQFKVSQKNPMFITQKGTVYLTATPKSELKIVDDFDPKLGFAYGFRATDTGQFLNFDDVYVKGLKPKIGIYKTDILPHRQVQSEAEKEGFFKFQFKRLKKGFAFGFYAQIDLSESYQFQSTDLLYLGKDRCPFKLEVKKMEATEISLFAAPSKYEKGDIVWLAADAHLNPTSVNGHCDGALTFDRSFRCLISQISDHFNYFSKPLKGRKRAAQMQFSSRYNLMRAGSILSVNEPEGLEKLLSSPQFHKIGYNHFLKIKSTHHAV